MKKNYTLLLFFLFTVNLFSQEGFKKISEKKQIKIPFQLANNLIVIPINLNGVDLNFLLDTGVEKTILFSLDNQSIEFKNAEKIKIKGLGEGEPLDAFHTKNNSIKIGGYQDLLSEVYIILDQNINFSSQLGIPIHGILGSVFFKNDLIEINYMAKKISILNRHTSSTIKKLKKHALLPITIELEKPYLEIITQIKDSILKTKMLLDTGGTDAVWLFENDSTIKVPEKNFRDFLGTGFSGEIHGKRSRIKSIQIANQHIQAPTASFPEALSIKNVGFVSGRNGSIGAAILKRFTIIFDYKNQKIYFKKNSTLSDPFNYNMSGLEFSHEGVQMVQEKTELKTSMVSNEISILDDRKTTVKYQFVLKPMYYILNVSPSSPADIAGIQKKDKLISINGVEAYQYKLYELNDIMQSEENKWITMEVERNGKIIKTKFQLKKIL